jgi:hypothetical protein
LLENKEMVLFALFHANSKTLIKAKTMLLTYSAGCDEIPAYAGMTMIIYFEKKRRGKHIVSHLRGNDVCRAAFSLQNESGVIPA